MRTQRPLRSRPHRRLRQLGLLTIATAATAGLSSTATAAVTGTSITSPTPYEVVDADYSQVSLGGEAPPELPTIRVTGTATTDGSSPNEVVVAAVVRFGPLTVPLALPVPVPVAADGSFAADVPVPPINAHIVAFPADISSDPVEDALRGVGPFRAVPVLGGGSISAEIPGLGNFSLALRGQRQGVAAIAPAGFAALGELPFGIGDLPLTIGLLGGVTSGAFGDAPGDFGLSFMGAGGITDQYNDARGGVMVDGTRGYLRDHLPLASEELPAATFERTVDRQTGGQTVVQTQPIYVAADPSNDPDDAPLEGGYRPSGLELQRTTVQDHDGRQVTVTDRFRSADGRAHKIDLLYAEGLSILPYNGRSPLELCLPILPCEGEGPEFPPPPPPFAPLSFAGDLSASLQPEGPAFPEFDPPAFRIPWETGDAWASRSHAEPLTAPSGAVSTLYTRLPNLSRLIPAFMALGSESPEPTLPITSTYGAITFGTRPDSGLFVSDPFTIGAVLGGASTQFVARFVRDVPAGGATTIPQVYSTGNTPAEAEALAAAAEQRLTPPGPAPVPPPVAPPAPPTPPAARKAPRKLSAASKLQRTKKGQFRFRFSGKLTLPSGVAKSACRAGGGTVTIQVKAGSNTISTRRVKLDRNCKYAVRINFRSAKRFGKRTRLTVVTKWSGNRALGPKPAKRFTVKVR
jgi:hypothetical protein